MALACGAVVSSCGMMQGIGRVFTGPEKESREGGTATSATLDAATDFWWYGVLGLIALVTFLPQVRAPIGIAIAAFFGIWGGLLGRLKSKATADPDD